MNLLLVKTLPSIVEDQEAATLLLFLLNILSRTRSLIISKLYYEIHNVTMHSVPKICDKNNPTNRKCSLHLLDTMMALLVTLGFDSH